MYFLHFLTLLMVISSVSNGEIYQNGTDDSFCPLNFIPSAYHQSVTLSIQLALNNEVYQNGNDVNLNLSNLTSSAYHHSVPLHVRLAVTFVLILMLTASYYLVTILMEEHFYEDDIHVTATYLLKMLIFHIVAVCLAIGVAPDQLEFGILISYGILVTASNGYFDVYRMRLCICSPMRVLLNSLNPPNGFVFRMIFGGILVLCAIVIIGVHFLLAYMTVMSVYKEIFSAFIPLTILLAMTIVGAKLIPSGFGLTVSINAMASLMLFVIVKLLATLSSALNDGKSIWPLTTTVIMAVMLIFAIRYLIISLVSYFVSFRKYPHGQSLYSIHIFWNFPATLQMAFICVLGYLTALIYSLFTH